jgi:peroxiredoxin
VEQGQDTGNVGINLTSFDSASTIAILTPIAVGEPAADFILQDIDGKQISPSDFAGKPIILNFWDSASGHCLRQIPHLDVLYRKYQGDGLVVMGVSKEMVSDDVLDFARSQMSYTIILNGAEAFQEYGVASIPCTYYVDRDGKVQYRDVGFPSDGEAKMEQKIKELLAR